MKTDCNFLNIASKLLSEGNTIQMLDVFNDQKNIDEIYNNSWDLIPLFASYLSEDHKYDNAEVFKCCEKLIKIMAERSNPEDMLLQLIEEIESAKDDLIFVSLLQPLQIVLFRVPDKRVTSLAWCFNAIIQYLKKLDAPDDHGLSEEEYLLMDSDETVLKITSLYENVLFFSSNLVNEISIDQSKNNLERKQIIGKFLVDLLGRPLGFFHLEMYRNTKPKAVILAETAITQFFLLSINPFSYFEITCDNELIKPNNLSLGVFFYLILSKEICFQYVPKVYNSTYVLQNSLNMINVLFVEGQLLTEKGLELIETLLKSLDNSELLYSLLDSEQHSKFCKNLCNIIIYSESENIRKKALAVIHKYLWAFESQGRFLLLVNLMPELTHSGLKGDLIVQYKIMMSEQIIKVGLKHLPKFYKNQKLFVLLDIFTLLKSKEESDLVDESDQIVSSLNLLRYLFLIDKDNDTGIYSYLDTLEKGYFNDLKVGIRLAREHYKLKIKEVTEEGQAKNCRDNDDYKMSVSVSGKNLLELSPQKKIEVLNLSLTTFDVLDSLLSRLLECINLNRKG